MDQKQNIVISVHNVEKSFRVYYDKGTSLKERFISKERSKYSTHDVLKGISFDVRRGEAIGLIGQNGCGKSTVLKMLSRIMYPDTGDIEIKGRVSALIELGAGFHPDMSGRENIFTNAAIFGLSRREIQNRIDDIIAFSELGEYIDNPVRTYSSGMYMRLAFSVAINVDADVLLIDEILAVGDAQFQAKCFNRLREIKAKGTTIVIVSHSLGQIEEICDKSIWICDGKIKCVGIPRYVNTQYLDYVGKKKIQADISLQKKHAEENHENLSDTITNEPIQTTAENLKKDFGNQAVVITSAKLLDVDGRERYTFECGEALRLLVNYKRNDPALNSTEFGFHFFRNDGVDCYGSNTVIDHTGPIPLQDTGVITVEFDNLSLLKGSYVIDLAFHERFGDMHHYKYSAIKLEIMCVEEEAGIVRLCHLIKVNGRELPKQERADM